MAGVEIRTVYAGVAGSHIRSQTSDGVAAIAGGEVTRADVDRVLEGARAIPVDADRQILHVLPREFIVDNQDGIRDPVGMSGVRLGVKVNLITAATSCVQNVIRCAERCGLTVADVVLEPLASAEAVLSEDEKEIGVAIIDIGGGTTDLLLYVDGGIAHASVIPVGGNNVTADISAGLRTPMGEAERLKRNSGCALTPDGRRRRGDRGARRRRPLARARPRAASSRTSSSPGRRRSSPCSASASRTRACSSSSRPGVVLTGGAVLLDGMTEFAEEILGMPVRLGLPVGVRGITQLVAGPAVRDRRGPGAVRRGRPVHARERAASSAEARPGRAPQGLRRRPRRAPRRRKNPRGATHGRRPQGRQRSLLEVAAGPHSSMTCARKVVRQSGLTSG